MYLPRPYQNFSKKYPEILKQHIALGTACREAGPLDEKHQNLIKLGIAVGADAKGGLTSSVRKALSTGATGDEIRHAVILALPTVGFSGMIGALEMIEAVLAKQDV